MIAITEMITIRTLNSRATAAANRIATLSETQDAKGEADIRQFHTTDSVCEVPGNDNEVGGAQSGDADRNVSQTLTDPQFFAHRRRYIQYRLREEPQGDDRTDDSQGELVGASILSGNPCGSSRNHVADLSLR
jgi:hypothetical protein